MAPRVPTPPRSTPSGRQLSRKAGGQIGALGITPHDVDQAIDHPHSIEATHQHNGNLFIRGGLGVIVPDDEPNTVIAIFRVDEHTTPMPRRGSGGGPSRHVPASFDEIARMLRAHGFQVTPSRGGHYKATHPNAPGVLITLPHTPGDRRSWLNLVADIRRHTRIDITQPAPASQ